MMRYKMILAYDGTDFQGWQTQHEGRAVQDEIQRVLSIIFNMPIHVHGASRTDAGVHAEGMVCHFDAPLRAAHLIKTSVNRLCEKTIVCRRVKRVEDDFQAQYTPSYKQYRYQIYNGERNPFLSRFALHYVYPLDLKRLRRVTRLWVGYHRFHQWTIKKEDRKDFYRTIRSIRLFQKDQLLIIRFVGEGFMTHMIRMMVGTLLAYNEGKITYQTIQDALNPHALRQPVSFKAPPHGLYLEKIVYEKP
jgi:tRNA pseudouridine38-40 synthase